VSSSNSSISIFCSILGVPHRQKPLSLSAWNKALAGQALMSIRRRHYALAVICAANETLGESWCGPGQFEWPWPWNFKANEYVCRSHNRNALRIAGCCCRAWTLARTLHQTAPMQHISPHGASITFNYAQRALPEQKQKQCVVVASLCCIFVWVASHHC
jgi:hypothetical protein